MNIEIVNYQLKNVIFLFGEHLMKLGAIKYYHICPL